MDALSDALYSQIQFSFCLNIIGVCVVCHSRGVFTLLWWRSLSSDRFPKTQISLENKIFYITDLKPIMVHSANTESDELCWNWQQSVQDKLKSKWEPRDSATSDEQQTPQWVWVWISSVFPLVITSSNITGLPGWGSSSQIFIDLLSEEDRTHMFYVYLVVKG